MTRSTEMSLADLLATRHSCRAFRPDPIPGQVLSGIFDSAQRTPSSCNSQPWSAYLTRGSVTADFATALTAQVLAQDAPDPDIDLDPAFVGTFLDRKRACGMALYASVGIERKDYTAREKQMLLNYQFFGAPHAAVFTSAASMGANGLIDSGGYMATVGLLAQEAGLGTVIQGAIALYAGAVRSYLGIPKDQIIIGGMSIGLADTDHPINSFRTQRASVGEVLHIIG